MSAMDYILLFWTLIVGIIAYCVGYCRGILHTFRDYHRFLDELNIVLKTKNIKTDRTAEADDL